MKPVALFITYTMLNPIVGGVFFRALRLARELHQRGWSPIIFNVGPRLQEPKIEDAKGKVQFIWLEKECSFDVQAARQQFISLDPTVIIMGEGPFETMRVFYDGARQTGFLFVVLDQYYNTWLMPQKEGVDLILLYGLRSFWPGLHLEHPYQLTPPFIEAVTPKAKLPIPAHLHTLQWVTFISYEIDVLQEGFSLLERLGKIDAAVVVVTHHPHQAGDLWLDSNLNKEKTIILPMQSDADLFGLIHTSAVVLLSNGFLQIMDSLALGCPVIALPRANNVGMTELNIAEQFNPYVCFGQVQNEQCERIRDWLAESPFSRSQLAALAKERGGINYCADKIENLVAGAIYRA